MYSFKNDYSEGTHPRILQALVETNLEQLEGYGLDRYSLEAAELIKKKIERSDVDIHLLTGGTQTNLTALSAFLRPHEAAIAASVGHINTHETGAIEATGHKIVTVDAADGKLNPSHLRDVLDAHIDEHMVKPKLVYISNSTEIGTIYKKSELEQLRAFCDENNLLLFMDGARLGSALCSKENDVQISDLPWLVDAFYIGGTKNGALLGEALVICHDSLKDDFRFYMKQRGAILAKGRLVGIQFLELFRDDLFFELASHANKMADKLKEELAGAHISFLTDSPSNQIFPILPNAVISELQNKYDFHIWEKVDTENSAIRLVTSWATKEEAVAAFIEDIK
ncbi:L-threonine aldolase [Schinkia azotoformans MEV2011]|uniref:L-threonine aldolase n=1 Tax=Schinkia azotoformans MEV2011 TaxID=1348973 RepID=A0A072NX82_SCHAZ|nr:aminotransferase class I/II-fold pyridoxal phosphate-dependent enzyme [Schinkia azotoformans]KEF37840.1 L-threonine aldolase [Schinkia azotoformans MEV2011]MEC1696522.1 aminotransferase class I/II-fold pyridoxal phosphate-dependent enzyme [Schinkia azotoformans]MEC1716099.1 aminotransferase class I/II-fold pyridoxal phosphate-dependent enzyme [Schinkia azotoformans]MEC1725987.1 aminotransferase class I/II-fold pyridoxal phosphate-dependent enzyme [Schinkia azotoformans]MEC1740570.1 aminotra